MVVEELVANVASKFTMEVATFSLPKKVISVVVTPKKIGGWLAR